MHVVLDRVARRFLGRLEQRADVDVEAEVGERGGDHLGAAVVAVLAELRDEHARPAAFVRGEVARPRGEHRVEVLVVGVAPRRTRRRSYGSRRGGGRTPPPSRRRSRRPWPGPGRASMHSASRLPSPAAPSVSASSAASAAASSRVAPDALEPRDLLSGAPRRCRCRARRRGSASSARYLLTPTIDLLAAVDARLAPGRGLLDAQLRHARLDGLRHAAELLDLLDERPGLRRRGLRERLDVVRAAERVDHVGDAGLLGEDQLRVARDAGREVGRQRRSPRRTRSCAGSACRRAPRRAPRTRCARCCCTGPAR